MDFTSVFIQSFFLIIINSRLCHEHAETYFSNNGGWYGNKWLNLESKQGFKQATKGVV